MCWPHCDVHEYLGAGEHGVVVEVTEAHFTACRFLHVHLGPVGQCWQSVVEGLLEDGAGWVQEGCSLQSI